MRSDPPVSANGRPRAPSDDPGQLSELQQLQATCRRQELVIDTLGEAVSTFHRGARALKAENVQLRAETDRLLGQRSPPARAAGRTGDRELLDVAIELGAQAPGLARSAVAKCLADRVPAPVLDSALLLVSELVTNSVRHSGVGLGEALVVRVHLWGDRCRLEVEDGGCGGVIAPQPPGMPKGGGMGLNLVQLLGERWGVVRAAEGPTRVWVQLVCGADAQVHHGDGKRKSIRVTTRM